MADAEPELVAVTEARADKVKMKTPEGEFEEVDAFLCESLATVQTEDHHWLIVKPDMGVTILGEVLRFHRLEDAITFIWATKTVMSQFLVPTPASDIVSLVMGAAVMSHVCGWQEMAQQGWVETIPHQSEGLH